MPCYDPRDNMPSFSEVDKSIDEYEIEFLLCEACFTLSKNNLLEDGYLKDWFSKHREEDRKFRLIQLENKLHKLKGKIQRCWEYGSSRYFKEEKELKDRIARLEKATNEELMKERL